jgi:hypothetical protein
MDAKEQSLVRDIHRKVTEHTFHERDVLALLILLRAWAPQKSAVHELADFVAHREKDRGGLKDYVAHVSEYLKAQATGRAGSLRRLV